MRWNMVGTIIVLVTRCFFDQFQYGFGVEPRRDDDRVAHVEGEAGVGAGRGVVHRRGDQVHVVAGMEVEDLADEPDEGRQDLFRGPGRPRPQDPFGKPVVPLVYHMTWPYVRSGGSVIGLPRASAATSSGARTTSFASLSETM